MFRSAKIHQFLIAFILVSSLGAGHVSAAENPFSWDLSYAAVFKANDVPENDTMLKFFRDAFNRKGRSRKMFVPDELFSDIDMSSLKQAILIDYQAFWYMGHRSAILYLASEESVVARTFDSKGNRIAHFKVRPEHFANLAEAIFTRDQSVPAGDYKFEVIKGFTFAGYIGVINTYSEAGANQQLITVEDFLNQKMEPGEFGRLVESTRRKLKPVEMLN